jgi:DNA uptake protein ComE-like DNA-binding protein
MAFFPEFLHYTRKERRGIFSLLFLIVLLTIIPKTLPWLIKKEAVDFSEFEVFLAETENTEHPKNKPVEYFFFDPNTLSQDSFQLLGLYPKTAQTIINYRKKGGRFANKEALQRIYNLPPQQYELIEPFIDIKKATPKPYKAKAVSIARFPFDPNTCSKKDLQAMGIPKKVIKTLINFRSKGGQFNTSQDLKKVYGITHSLYASLAPYIQISKPTSEEKKFDPRPYKKEETKVQLNIDINKATPEEWQSLRGIGPAYAKWIINFREKLGGFSSISQVGDTYNLPDSTFQTIKPFLTLSPVYRKISINKADLETLKNHPLLKWKEAKAILNYRQNHGDFMGAGDFSKIRALSPESIERILPYLNFDVE